MNIKNPNKLIEAILKIVLMAMGGVGILVLAALYSIITGGYIGMKVYNWFIPNIYHLSFITLYQAIGISFVLNALRHEGIKNYVEDKDKKMTVYIVNLILPWFLYLLAYIFHQYFYKP